MEFEHSDFLAQLVLLVAMAAGGAALFERLRLPSIAGFLVTGALLGPGGLALVDDPSRVRELAELGVVFLLFEIGLELPVERVRRLWRRAATAGGLQMALTTGLGTGLALVLGLGGAQAFVLGALVAMSSTALVMGELTGRGEIDAPQGQLSVGILLFQDLCIVPLLLVVPLLAEGEAIGTAALLGSARALLALAVFYVVARRLLPLLLERVVARRSHELFTLLAFLVVVGSAWVAREIGLTLAVGAFVGGLVLSSSPYSHQLFAEVVPLRGVLLGIFFTAVGMLVDPRLAWAEIGGVAVYVVAVVMLKAGVVAWIVGQGMGLGPRLGIVTGLGLAQTGEFSFVLAEVASGHGLLDPELRQIFVTGSALTLLATPFLVRVAPRVASRLARSARGRELEQLSGETEEQRDHVVLLGFGLAGQTLARVLRAREIPYVAAEANSVSVQDARSRGEPVVYGDVTRRALLSRLGVERAALVVLTISDPVATRETARIVHELAPDVPLVARTRFVLEVDPLYAAGASAVVAEEFESTIEVLSRALGVFGIPQQSIARFAEELREEGYEPMRQPALALDPWFGEILEEVATEWVEVHRELAAAGGGPATLAGLELRGRSGCSVLAVERRGALTPNPGSSQSIQVGDRLLAFGAPAEIARLRTWLEEV